jgi:hypothetical protein
MAAILEVEFAGTRVEVSRDLEGAMQRMNEYRRKVGPQNLLAAMLVIVVLFFLLLCFFQFSILSLLGLVGSIVPLVALASWGSSLKAVLYNDPYKLGVLAGLFSAAGPLWPTTAPVNLQWSRKEIAQGAAGNGTSDKIPFSDGWVTLKSETSNGHSWTLRAARDGWTQRLSQKSYRIEQWDVLTLTMPTPKSLPSWWKDCFGGSPRAVKYEVLAGEISVSTSSEVMVQAVKGSIFADPENVLLSPKQFQEFLEWFLVGAEQVAQSCLPETVHS